MPATNLLRANMLCPQNPTLRTQECQKWMISTVATDKLFAGILADMIMRNTIDPVSLGAARGRVVSAEYTYLVGTESGFAERFIAKSLIPRLAQV